MSLVSCIRHLRKKYYLKTKIRKTKQMLHKTAFVSKLSKRFNLISEIS